VDEQRIGDAHRTHVLELLGYARSEGHLSPDEYETRTAAIVQSHTVADLQAQLADLPPQFQWDPQAPLPAERRELEEKQATNLATLALILGAASIPLAFCFIGALTGAAPIQRGEPGYRAALDRDNDGIACE
jgi:hypothetical protein